MNDTDDPADDDSDNDIGYRWTRRFESIRFAQIRFAWGSTTSRKSPHCSYTCVTHSRLRLRGGGSGVGKQGEHAQEREEREEWEGGGAVWYEIKGRGRSGVVVGCSCWVCGVWCEVR